VSSCCWQRANRVHALIELPRREADIAIRHVQPIQPELNERPVREASAGFDASDGCVRRHGQWLLCSGRRHPPAAGDAC
jgi:hypothetical protein